MAVDKAKRQKVQNHLLDVLTGLDPTHKNALRYKNIFDNMSDTQFDNFMKDLRDNEDANINIEIEAYEVELDMDNIKDTAKKIGVPLFEKVAIPFLSPTGQVFVTPYEVPVGYVLMNRLQQTSVKKNSMSINVEQRNAKVGQVTGHDKNGRSSDMENIALITIGAMQTLKEFNGPKADDMYMKTESLKAIKNEGVLYLDKIQSNKVNKTALNTLDAYFIAAGIKTDLITNGLLLPRTLQNLNKDVSSLSAKNNQL